MVALTLEKMIKSLTKYLPLTYTDIVFHQLEKSHRSILDVGCGNGNLAISILSRLRMHSVGLDVHVPYVKEAKVRGAHNDYVIADARLLPFRLRSFDAVLCSQVIEHVKYEDGIKLLNEMETVASKQVILGTPVGFIPYAPINEVEHSDTRLEAHKSGWHPSYLIRRGYKIKYQGLSAVYGEKGLARKIPKTLRPMTYIMSYLLAPLTYFYPNLAVYMICVKRLEQSLAQ